MHYQNKRSEAARKLEMEKLLARGGTVADKCVRSAFVRCCFVTIDFVRAKQLIVVL